jgi:tripartite-type tricarboxylate transporter receptor subunit TctC
MNAIRILRSGFAALAVIGLAGVSAAANADDFYDGRTVTVVVPSGSGGTYHVYCQLVARNIGRHIPGNPNVITQNRPGAGGAKAARYMVTAAPKDGTYIAMINPGSIMLPLLRPGIGFDTREMQWLGSMSARTYTVATFDNAPAKTLAEAKKTEVLMGTTGKASTSYLIPSFINQTVGTKFKIITGYKGGGAINLAMERGEVQGRGNFYSGYTGVRPHWLKEGKLNFLFTLGPSRPEVKNIPRLRDAMDTPLKREMLDILEVSFNVGQAFFAPPGVPAERVAVLRKAFADMVKDPRTLDDANKRRVPLNSRTDEEVAASINKGFGASPEAAKTLRKMLGFDKKKS